MPARRQASASTSPPGASPPRHVDPGLVRELGQPRCGGRRQPVGAMHGELERVGEQVDDVEVGGRLVVDGQREVDLAAAQAGDAVGRRRLLHGDRDARVAGPERVDGARDDRRPRGRERRQPQRAAAQVRQVGERRLGGVELVQHRLRVAEQDAARLGERHTARAALDEHDAGLTLERRDLLGDRRGRVGQRVGGGAQRPLARDLAQHAQPPHVEHRRIVPPVLAAITRRRC